MTLTKIIEYQGCAFLPAFHPTLNPEAAAFALGSPELVDGLRLVQELLPTASELTTPNTYSGNFGLEDFPFHTDLAHWARPPRYLMLRCAVGDPTAHTRVIDGMSLVEALAPSTLARCLVRPRRPMKGSLQLLPIWQYSTEVQQSLIRWDSVYLQPTNEYSLNVFQQVKDWISVTRSETYTLTNMGDTLLLDNWRMLHGRSAISSVNSFRKIHRIYLSSLT